MPGDTPDEFEAELSEEIERHVTFNRDVPTTYRCQSCLQPVNERPGQTCPACEGSGNIQRLPRPAGINNVYRRIRDMVPKVDFPTRTMPGSAHDNLNTRHEKLLARLRALRNTAEGNSEHMSRVDTAKSAIHGFYAQSLATALEQDWEASQRARTTPAPVRQRTPTRENDFTANGVPLTPGTAAALIHAIENVRTRESVAVLTRPASPENDKRQDDYDRLGQVIGVLRQAFGLEAEEPPTSDADRVRDEEEI